MSPSASTDPRELYRRALAPDFKDLLLAATGVYSDSDERKSEDLRSLRWVGKRKMPMVFWDGSKVSHGNKVRIPFW